MVKIKDEIQTESQTETPVQEAQATPAVDPSLFKLIQDLQRKIDVLEQGKTKKLENKEHYEGPLAYNYKLWDGQPVLDYRSVKKDSAKPLLYKDPMGNFIDNHCVELLLPDGRTKKPILLYEFNMHHTQSDKQFVSVETVDGEFIKDRGTKHLKRGEVPAVYIFNTEEFGELRVNPKAIN